MVTQTPPRACKPKVQAGRHVSAGLQTYCRALLARLPWPSDGLSAPLQTLGLTSCYRGEGVSTLASQLALTAAVVSQQRILLVDGDADRPAVAESWKVPSGPGLSEVLLAGEDLFACIQSTELANLVVLPAGSQSLQNLPADEGRALAELLEALGSNFGLVVFDLPPVDPTGQTIRWAPLLDGMVLVVEAERTRWEVARRAAEELRRSESRLLGAVFNKRRRHVPQWLYRTL